VIYPQLLESEFDKLPRVLRDLHGSGGRRKAVGRVTIRREPGLLPRLVGFPPSQSVPVQLDIIVQENREVWIRRFGTAVRRSVQRAEGGLMVEAMGALRLYFGVFAFDSGIKLELVRARLLGIPLPLHIEAAERGRESSWEFEVTVGRIGSYRGSMELTV